MVDVFWQQYIVTNKMPDGKVPRLDSHKRVRRNSEQIELNTDASKAFDELCLKHESLKKEAQASNKALSSSKSELLSFMGDSEGCESADFMLSYAPSYRKEYTVSATEVRTFRLKEKKKSGGKDE